MSMENAVNFYEKLEGDLELQKRISETGSRENLEHLVRDELGYDFTEEEMQKVIFDKNPELSDEELEIVVGGLTSDEAIIMGVSCGFSFLSGAAVFSVLIACISAA